MAKIRCFPFAALGVIGLLAAGCARGVASHPDPSAPRSAVAATALVPLELPAVAAPRDRGGGMPPREALSRSICPNDVVYTSTCMTDLHQQPREFWEAYQQEASALREGFLACWQIRNDFGDWVRASGRTSPERIARKT